MCVCVRENVKDIVKINHVTEAHHHRVFPESSK